MAPVGSNVNDVLALGGSHSWLPVLSHSYVHEPFTGAWQRNVAESCHPSILAFSAVYACISIISGDLAKLPLRIVKVNGNGERAEFVNHPINGVLWKPNDFQTRVDFVQQMMVSTLTTGNAFIWKQRDNRNVVKQMYVLDPRKVTTLVGDNGEVFYKIKKDVLQGFTEDSIILPASEIIHHRLMCLEHPLVGVSPLYAAGTSASVGARIMMNSSTFFSNQSRPSGMLVASGRISKETAQMLKQEWEANFSNGRVGRTAVLGEGLKWEPLVMSAIDAQLIDQLRWSVEDVARVFRVPVFLLGDLSKVSYRNSEQLARTYYSGCLQYHIESLEARFDDAFQLANDVFIEFDLDPLLRTEMDVRFTAWATAINAGFKTINEVRKKEGDGPMVGANEPLVQVQYVPLSLLGKARAEEQEEPEDDLPLPPVPIAESFDVDDALAHFDVAFHRASIPQKEIRP